MMNPSQVAAHGVRARDAALAECLERIHAQIIARGTLNADKGVCTLYSANGKPFFIAHYGEKGANGWELFVPVSSSNQVVATLVALENYVNIK